MARPIKTGIAISNILLTGNFVDGNILQVDSQEQCTLFFKYTRNAGEISAYLVFKIEYSIDGVNFYQESEDDGTADLAAGTTTTMDKVLLEHKMMPPVTPCSFIHEIPFNAIWVKISFKELSVVADYGYIECDYLIRTTS